MTPKKRKIYSKNAYHLALNHLDQNRSSQMTMYDYKNNDISQQRVNMVVNVQKQNNKLFNSIAQQLSEG